MSLVRTAIAAIVAGAASGGAVVSVVLAGAHGMARGADQPFADIALGGGAAGLVIAAAVAFLVGRPLGAWRAAAVAVSAVAGCALVTVLTLPVDMATGRTGLWVLAGLCLATLGGVWWMRAREPAPG
jgi:hypothetical protein